MRKLRTGTPQPEKWKAEDIMSYLGCDEQTAKKVMEDCRTKNNLNGYGAIEKHIILDFINEKQRAEREREARYNADIAHAETAATLKEQVETLKEQVLTLKEQVRAFYDMNASASADAYKARTQALIANLISGISILLAILALALN